MDSQGENNMKPDDFRHFCSLCMESYCGRIPKLLPCYHTFCLPCLTVLVEKRTWEELEGKDGESKGIPSKCEPRPATATESSQNVDDEKEESLDVRCEASDVKSQGESTEAATERKSDGNYQKRLQCPTCRAQVVIPSGGVSALQTNFYVTVDVDSTSSLPDKGPRLCEMCEEGLQEEAEHFCHNCRQHMCRACRRLHDRVIGAGDHRVESLSNQTTSKLEVAAKGKKLCQFHPDQSLCFHCLKCDVTICLHCKLTSHEGHDTQDMATAAVQAKGDLPDLHARANKQCQLLEACISRLERDELDLKRQKREAVQQVSSRYDLLIGWATRARDEFLEEVAAQEQTYLNEIHTRKASASFFKGNISSKKMRASHTTGLGAVVVLMKNELQAALLKDKSLEDHQKLAERKEHLTFFSNVAETSILNLSTMQAYMGKLIDSSADSTDIPKLSYPELVSAVSRIETDLEELKINQQDMETDLQDMKDEHPVTKVSFHVNKSTNSTCSANQNIIFNDVRCNEGEGYDSSTGIFTAPAEGTYIFTATMQNQTNGSSSGVRLMVDGTEWARADCAYSCTATCVVHLNKWNQASVQSCATIACRQNATMFSGALLSM